MSSCNLKSVIDKHIQDDNEKKTNNLENITLKLTKYLDCNIQQVNSSTLHNELNKLLLMSVRNKELKTTKILLSRYDIDINCVDINGLTPILLTIINHDINILNLLLNHPNIDINKCDKDGWSPLMVAIATHDDMNDNIPIIKMLLDKNIIINNSNKNGYTPMIICAMNGEFEIMKLLVNNGSNVNEKDSENISVFVHAVMFTGKHTKFNNDMLDYLIENNADIHFSNINNQSALFMCAHNGYFNMVKYCIEKNMDINQRDINGITPMEQAYKQGYKEIANYLAKMLISTKQ